MRPQISGTVNIELAYTFRKHNDARKQSPQATDPIQGLLSSPVPSFPPSLLIFSFSLAYHFLYTKE